MTTSALRTAVDLGGASFRIRRTSISTTPSRSSG